MRLIRVFLSSPGDVAEERRLAREVLQTLGHDPLLKGHVALEAVSWDDPEAPSPMLAGLTPQQAVDRGLPRPSECEIAVVIFWGRMGTPLTEPRKADGSAYLSGTEYEYEDARNGRTLILLYRRTARIQIDLDLDDTHIVRQRAQKARVDGFFARLVNADGSLTGGYTEYETVPEFRTRLEKDLKALVRQLLGEADGGATIGRAADATLADAFPRSEARWRAWVEGQARAAAAEFDARMRRAPDDATSAAARYLDRSVEVSDPRQPGSISIAPLSSLIERPGARVFVLGAGGTGKTTVLARTAHDAAAAAARQPGLPVPILVKLNFFDVSERAFDALMAIVGRAASVESDIMHRLWNDRDRPLLFLFDGLNEVDPRFIDACREALRQFLQRDVHRYVITSRQDADTEEFARQFADCRVAKLLELDDHQIRRFLEVNDAAALYDRLTAGVRNAVRNPYALWAETSTWKAIGHDRLSSTPGQAQERLVDEYIFQMREREKPKAVRPTKYEYFEVKKPVLADLAAGMCERGVTRYPVDEALTRFWILLQQIRDRNAGRRRLEAHRFMPDPPAADMLLDEIVQNGVLTRTGDTVEFMHQSVRDYFAAVHLRDWPMDAIANVVSRLRWGVLEPGYYPLAVDGAFDQASIVLAGLLPDASALVTAVAARHPLLASQCAASARAWPSGAAAALRAAWLDLLHKHDARYRWLACQCLGIAFPSDVEVAERLVTVASGDTNGFVAREAVRALSQSPLPIIQRLLNHYLDHVADSPWRDEPAKVLEVLASPPAVRFLLEVWGDPAQPAARRERAQGLMATLPRRMAEGELHNASAGSDVVAAGASAAALSQLDSWKALGFFTATRARDMSNRARAKMNAARQVASSVMRGWPLERLIAALDGPEPATQAAAAALLADRHVSAAGPLLDALARSDSGGVRPELLRALSASSHETVFAEWSARMRAPEFGHRFDLPPERAAELASDDGLALVLAELEMHGLPAPRDGHLVRVSNGWRLEPGSYSGKFMNPCYELIEGNGALRVFDAAARAQIVAASSIIGPTAVPALERWIDDPIIGPAVPEVLGQIGGPDAVALLGRLLAAGAGGDVLGALARAGSPAAIPHLMTFLREFLSFGADQEEADARRTYLQLNREHLVKASVETLKTLNGRDALVEFAREAAPPTGASISAQRVACEALAQWTPKTPDIETLLYGFADSGYNEIRVVAVSSLAGVVSEQATAYLIDLSLTDSSAQVRNAAVAALRHHASDVPLHRFQQVLGLAVDEQKPRAAEALGLLQDPAAADSLKACLCATSSELRVAAATALILIGFAHVDAAVDVLVAVAIDRGSGSLRSVAFEALTNVPGAVDRVYAPIDTAFDAGRWNEVVSLIGDGKPFGQTIDPRPYYLRGLAQYQLSNWPAALDDLERTIDMASPFADVFAWKAMTLDRMGQPLEALSAAREAVRLNPDSAAWHDTLAWCAYRAGSFDETIAESRKALELDDTLASAAFHLGLAHLALNRREEAEAAYQRAVLLCPGATVEQQQDRKAAIDDLAELAASRPERAPAAAALIAIVEDASDEPAPEV